MIPGFGWSRAYCCSEESRARRRRGRNRCARLRGDSRDSTRCAPTLRHSDEMCQTARSVGDDPAALLEARPTREKFFFSSSSGAKAPKTKRSTTTRTSSATVSNAPTTQGRQSRRRGSVRFSPRADTRSTKDSSRHRGFTFAGGRRSAPNAASTVRTTGSSCPTGSSAESPRSGTLARPPLCQRAGQRTLRTQSLRSCSRLVLACRRSR
jgi:hypothetical protein